jgi:hypothetical protein
MNYKVRSLEDGIYQIFEVDNDGLIYYSTVLFQGTLSECESWIRLTEEGYL